MGGGMVIKEVEMCIGMVRLGLEFVMVFAQAAKKVIHQSFDADLDLDLDLDLDENQEVTTAGGNYNSNSSSNIHLNNYNYQVPFPYPGILP